MIKSEHEKVVLQKRDEARLKLIDLYTEIAITQSDELGFLNVMGHEVPDPTVMEPPLGYVAQPDLMEQMRRMISTELSRIAEDQEFETMQEADDFDIDDDPVDYSSPYEEFFDPAPGAPAGPPGEIRPAPNEVPPEGPGPEAAKPGGEAPPAKPTP